MFRFANPEFLYLLFILPVLLAVYVLCILAEEKGNKEIGKS